MRSGFVRSTHRVFLITPASALPKSRRCVMDSEAEFNLLNEVVDSSSSDDDEFYIAAAHIVAMDISNEPHHRGSVEGHGVLNRDRQLGHVRLYQDYFSDDPTYEPNYFRRRFVRTPYFFSIIPCIYIFDFRLINLSSCIDFE